MNASDESPLRAWRDSLVTFATWRGLLLAMAYVALPLVPKMGSCRPQWEVFGSGHDFWNGFFRWDAGWYRLIAEKGYSFHADHTSSVAFYPMYPYLSRWLGRGLGGPFVAGLVISAVGSIAGVHYMQRLGKLCFPLQTTSRAVVLLLVFPTSFFLSAFYTEGLFFGLAAASLYCFHRERYVTSGALGGLAMLARSSGTALFAAMAVDLGVRLLRRQTKLCWSMLGLGLIPLGLVAFMGILKVQVGDPLAFTKTMAFWGRVSSLPWEPLISALRLLSPGLPKDFESAQRVIDAAFALSFLVAGAAMIRHALRAPGDSPRDADGVPNEADEASRFPLSLGIFVLAGVLLPLCTTNIASMGRYVLSLFPAFYWFAHVTRKRPVAAQLLLVCSTFFLAVYTLRFMRCGWAG